MTKLSKKVIGILLAICMLASLFTCLSGLTVSADGDYTGGEVDPAAAAKMLHVDNNTGSGYDGYLTYVWRPIEETDIVKPSTKYRVSFNWENVSNAAIDGSERMFELAYYNGTKWACLFRVDDMSGAATDKAVNKTELPHGHRFDLDFTTPEDCADGGSICLVFGDIGWVAASGSMIFNIANVSICTRDDSDNLTELPITDIGANTTFGEFTGSIYADHTAGQVLERGGKYAKKGFASFVDIPDGYFGGAEDPGEDPGENPGEDTGPKMLHVDNSKASGYEGFVRELWRPQEEVLRPSTNYRLSFCWESIAGPLPDTLNTGYFFVAHYYDGSSWPVLFRLHNLTGNATDITVNKTDVNNGVRFDIDFTTPADCADGAGIAFIFGDINWAYGSARMAFNVGNFKIYTRDESEDLTEVPITDIGGNTTLGEYDTVADASASTEGQVLEQKDRKGYASFLDIPEGYFDEPVVETAPKMLHVDNSKESGYEGFVRELWRPQEEVLRPSTNYRLSFCWESIAGPLPDTLNTGYFFVAHYYDGSSWPVLFRLHNLTGNATDITVNKTDVNNGVRFDIDFTTPADCADGAGIAFIFGDINWQYGSSKMAFNVGNFKIYTRDESEDLTEVPITDIGGNTTLGEYDTVADASASTEGQVLEHKDYKGYASFLDIPEGYFDEPVVETAPKMVHIDTTAGYANYQWRPAETEDVIKPSTKYRVSFIWENISNASLDTSLMFYAKYYDGTEWKYLFKMEDGTGESSDIAINKTNLNHGQKVEVDFTSPADCVDGDSLCFFFGDWNWIYSGSRMAMNLAEIKLYTRDESDNLTEVPITDICANETLGEQESWKIAADTHGQVLERGGSNARKGYVTFEEIPEGYFDVPVEDPGEDPGTQTVSTKMLHIDNTDDTKERGYEGFVRAMWRPQEEVLRPSTNYRLSFCWESIAGPLPDTLTTGYFFVVHYYDGSSWPVLFRLHNLTGDATDITVNKTELNNGVRFDIDFTTPASCADGAPFACIFGDINWAYGYARMAFNVGNFKLYTRDGSENLTKVPITDIGVNTTLGEYDTVNDASASTEGQVLEQKDRKGYASFLDIPEDYFDLPGKMIHVDNQGTSVNDQGQIINDGYVTYVWRPSGAEGALKPNTKYRISFYWETGKDSLLNLDTHRLFEASYYNGTAWGMLLRANDLTAGAATDVVLTKTDLKHGQKIEIDFTTPEDCANGSGISFVFGDPGWAFQGHTADKRMQFNIAKIKLYTRDDSDNLTRIPTEDLCANEEFGEFTGSIYADHPMDQVLERGGSYVKKGYATFEDIPDGYFDLKPPYTPGDINDDGEVDNKDLIRLFQYLSEWEVEVSEGALDVNGDGETDNKDLIRLFQYLSEWEVEIF